MVKRLLSKGAEAEIYLDYLDSMFLGYATIIKKRISKGYRHKILDEKIRTKRTKSEAKILQKARKAKINVPKIDSINKDKKEIYLEYLEGERLSETLNKHSEEKQKEIMKKIGKQVSLLHEEDIIHGDLTTSNIILNGDKIFIIDFGLGFISNKIEDKAVDLHLIKQALEAKHYQNWQDLFFNFKESYKWKDSKKIIERFGVVEKRGRYKH